MLSRSPACTCLCVCFSSCCCRCRPIPHILCTFPILCCPCIRPPPLTVLPSPGAMAGKSVALAGACLRTVAALHRVGSLDDRLGVAAMGGLGAAAGDGSVPLNAAQAAHLLKRGEGLTLVMQRCGCRQGVAFCALQRELF